MVTNQTVRQNLRGIEVPGDSHLWDMDPGHFSKGSKGEEGRDQLQGEVNGIRQNIRAGI